MNKKYQIFISSTYTDLTAERAAARDAILRMNHFPVGMEQFGAADEEQWEIIKQTIDTSDYYVLIIGRRYGSAIKTGPNAGISYTEMEYQYAKSVGLPILAFLPDDDVPIRADQLEGDDSRAKLNAFIASVSASKLFDRWKNADDLAAKLTAALHKQFERTDRPGWVRGENAEKSLQTIVGLFDKVTALEEENKKLRLQSMSRTPELEINLSCCETLSAAEDDFNGWKSIEGSEYPLYNASDEMLTIYIQRIQHGGYLGNTDRLCFDDVPEKLRPFVNAKQLEEYNYALPEKEAVKQYDTNMHRFRSVKANGLVLNASIYNSGNAKATDIHVEIEFPSSFIVMEKEDAIFLDEPERPHMPKNPIIKAKEEYDRAHSGMANMFDLSLGKYLTAMDAFEINMPLKASVKPALLLRSLHPASSAWSLTADEQSVHIWKDSLIQTYEWDGGEFVIAPTSEGEFTVKISAICGELPEPAEYEYKIKVVDMGY